jgi:hypothetical protein
VTVQVLAWQGTSRTFVLAPGTVTVFDDLLGTMGYTGGAAILLLHPEDQPIYATAEVYVDGPGGRYTTVVPVIDPSSDRRRVTLGVSNSSNSRTNVGCASLSDRAQAVRASVYDATGSYVGTVLLATNHNAWTQAPLPFDVSDGYVVWEVEADASVHCFVVNVDNTSNDGSLFR